jgi:hypothetical protein
MITTIGRWAQAPDLIGPIVGYRGWRYSMSERGVHLFAFSHIPEDRSAKNDWEGAWSYWVTASCRYALEPTHVAPDEDCTCGFYATKSADDVAGFAAVASHPQAGDSLQGEGEDGAVLGRVLLAGKVIEHASGYRAERARIAELIPTTTDGGITRSLASRLELPVGPTMDTTSLLREMQEALRLSETMPPRPGLIERWRLRSHRRHFLVIRGAGDDYPEEVQPPRPAGPRGGGSSPSAA